MMQKTLQKLAFVLGDFPIGGPGQQLLDRFLIGYPRDGEFHRLPELQIAAWFGDSARNGSATRAPTPEFAARERDFRQLDHGPLDAVIDRADAVLVVPAPGAVSPREDFLTSLLEGTPSGAACFVHGCLATTLAGAQRLEALAARRKVQLAAATSVATTFRLPEVDIAKGIRLTEALVVVQGPAPLAELSAMDGLLPVIGRRRGGDSGIASVRRLRGPEVWRAGDNGEWSWELLSAALSRSNTAQGDSERESRPQDLVRLGLVPKLARDPRGWIILHRDGLRTTILVLDGVVADFNFAVRSHRGALVSAQLYRPPAPNRAEFDRLAAALEDFFTTRKRPWPLAHSLVTSEFLEKVNAA